MPFPTLDQAVLALKRTEIDALIDDRYMAAYSLANVPGVGHLEIVPGTIGTVECAVAVRNRDTALLEMVNEVIDKVNGEDLHGNWIQEAAGELMARIDQRHPDRLERQRKAEQPRRVVIRIRKDDNYDFDIYRMANLSFSLTDQDSGKSYYSSRIDFKNRVGFSSTTVPPGTYKISIPKMSNWTPGSVSIEPADPEQVTVTIRLGRGVVQLSRS